MRIHEASNAARAQGRRWSRGAAHACALAGALAASSAAGCAGSTAALRPPTADEQALARGRAHAVDPAVAALGRGDLDAAARATGDVLARDADHPEALALDALIRYVRAAQDLAADVTTVALGAAAMGRLNTEYLQASAARAQASLDAVDGALGRASRGPGFALELCPACWPLDWDRNGRADERDQRLMEVELDALGQDLPPGDARRRPTFAFDRGDLDWARAMIAFQSSVIDTLMAWRWSDVMPLVRDDDRPATLTIHVDDPARLARAKASLRRGLEHAEHARQQYLAEVDDDREWVPNPSQHSHAVPLAVDAALYETWGSILGDVDRLLAGEEGIDLGELSRAADPARATHPHGFMDVGALFALESVTVDVLGVREGRVDEQQLLQQFLGRAYRERMKPSPLPARLARMRAEIQQGTETLEKKLKYLLWLN